MFGNIACISQLSHCKDGIPDTGNLKEEMVIWFMVSVGSVHGWLTPRLGRRY